MDLRDTREQADFREELRDWLGRSLPEGWDGPDRSLPDDSRERDRFLRAWQRGAYEAGYVAVTWPERYGGRGLDGSWQAIIDEELARARAPEFYDLVGLYISGPTIVQLGSEEQRLRYLPTILTGGEPWCQGFSEPNAGSDLAALQTRAVDAGDAWVVNGQKVWTTGAQIAKWCLLLARTERTGEKHDGITALIIDMESEGVEVRPLVQMTGDTEFNEMFFTDVRVPKGDVLGDVNGGWKVTIATLAHERANLGMAFQVLLDQQVGLLTELARRLADDGGRPVDHPRIRQKLARVHIAARVNRLTNYRAMTRMRKGEGPGLEGNLVKLYWSLQAQQVAQCATELLGLRANLSREDTRAVQDGAWEYLYLRARGRTIEAGTSEVLKNVLAERALGLPKG